MGARELQIGYNLNSPLPAANLPTDRPVLGASGDLAFKKTFPAIFALLKHGLLPPSVQVVGYARTKMDLPRFRVRATSRITARKGDEAHLEAFTGMLSYVSGQYDKAEVRNARCCRFLWSRMDRNSDALQY